MTGLKLTEPNNYALNNAHSICGQQMLTALFIMYRYMLCIIWKALIIRSKRSKLQKKNLRKYPTTFCVTKKLHLYFSHFHKAVRLKECVRGEDNILSCSSRPARPVIELERRRASSNKPRPWSHPATAASARRGEAITRTASLLMRLFGQRKRTHTVSCLGNDSFKNGEVSSQL